MDSTDLLQRRTNQAIGIVACLANNDKLSEIDNELVRTALWAIEDMLLEMRDLQEHLLDDRKTLGLE